MNVCIVLRYTLRVVLCFRLAGACSTILIRILGAYLVALGPCFSGNKSCKVTPNMPEVLAAVPCCQLHLVVNLLSHDAIGSTQQNITLPSVSGFALLEIK